MRKLPVLQENFIPNGQIIIRANQTKPNQSKPIQAKRIETSGQKLSKYHVDGRRMKIKDNQPPMELRFGYKWSESRNKILAQSACENLYVCA